MITLYESQIWNLGRPGRIPIFYSSVGSACFEVTRWTSFFTMCYFLGLRTVRIRTVYRMGKAADGVGPYNYGHYGRIYGRIHCQEYVSSKCISMIGNGYYTDVLNSSTRCVCILTGKRPLLVSSRAMPWCHSSLKAKF